MQQGEGFFFPSADPNVDADMRKRIALAMLARGRRAFPKNLGEGIASIGQEIGDALAERSVLAENAAGNVAADAFKAKYTNPSPQAAVAPLENMPPAPVPPAVAAASVAPPTPPIVPAAPPRARTVMPAPIPPPDGTPGNTGATTFPPPFQPPPGAPPVVAQDGEDPRRAIGLAMMRQQMGGAPPPAPAAPTPQAIPAAPPQPQVRAMPPPQVAQGPQIVDPGPEPTPGRTMTDLQQRILQDIDKEPPARRAGARAAVEPILQREQAIIDRENAITQQKHALWTARTKMRDEQTYNAPKDTATIAHTQAQTEAARLQEVSGKMVRNPDGSYSPPRITGVDSNAAPDVKLNESQTKALTYHDWASIGNETVKKNEKLLAEGGAQAALGKTPFIGNALLSAKYRKAQAGADQFVNAFMRATSGGAYGEQEAAREAKAMLPKVSDDPQTLELKRTQRDAFIKNLYGGLGEGKKLADFYGNERKEKQQQKFEKLNAEMEGKDKSKTYQKNGVFREWVGDHWEEH